MSNAGSKMTTCMPMRGVAATGEAYIWASHVFRQQLHLQALMHDHAWHSLTAAADHFGNTYSGAWGKWRQNTCKSVLAEQSSAVSCLQNPHSPRRLH